MFFTAVGMVLVALVSFAARHLMTFQNISIWKGALMGSLFSFVAGAVIDSQAGGILYWMGETGLWLSGLGNVVVWGLLSAFAVIMGLRASARLRDSSSDDEPASSMLLRAGSRLDLMMIVTSGVLLYHSIPGCLDSAAHLAADLSAAPVTEEVTFEVIRLGENPTYRGFGETREAVFARRGGSVVVVPLPSTPSMDDRENIREITAQGSVGKKLELTYYPASSVVVSLRETQQK